MLILPLTGSITCPKYIESTIIEIYILDDDLNDEPDCKNMVMSIDSECPIYDFGRVKGKISFVKIGANISNDKSNCLVLPSDRHINNQKLLIRIQLFLSQVYVVFFGRMIENDIAKIKKDYQIIYFSVSNVVDIGTMDIHRGLATKNRVTTTLQALVAKLGHNFAKAR